MAKRGRTIRYETLLFGAFFFLSILIILSQIAFLYGMFRRTVISEVAESRDDVLSLVSSKLDLVKSSLDTAYNLYSGDEQIAELVEACDGGDMGLEEAARQLRQIDAGYRAVMNKVNLRYDCVILSDQGFCYNSQGKEDYQYERFRLRMWFEDVKNSEIHPSLISTFDDSGEPGERKYVFANAGVRYLDDGKGHYIYIILLADEQILADIFKDIKENEQSSLSLVDRSGKIVSHTNRGMVALNFYNMKSFNRLFGEQNHVIIDKSERRFLFLQTLNRQTGWYVVEEIPLDLLLEPLTAIRTAMLLIFAVLLIFSLAAARILAKTIAQPLKRLENQMAGVRGGNLVMEPPRTRLYEVSRIADSAESMVDRIKRQMEDIKVSEENKRRAEIDFLQAQINPHFLHNSLLSVLCLIELKEEDKAARMVRGIMAILKNILYVKNDRTTIADEIEILDQYIEIMNIEYDYQISLEIDADNNALDCRLPRMLLQPILENSIFHGIKEDSTFELAIRFTAYIREETLFLIIADNGNGFSEDCKKAPKRKSHGIGLANIDSRIKMIYGQEYGLSVEKQTAGAKVRLTLPVERQGGES